MIKPLSLILLATVLDGSLVAAADDLYTRYFASGGKPCYARYYDDAHLRAHPKQVVRRIEIDFDVTWRENETSKNSAADFQAGIGFMLRRSSEWYGQALYCKTVSDHFECYLDADGGSFQLIPRGDALRLEVSGPAEATIHAEGIRDFGEFGGPGGDDRVFVLPRADRKLCDAAKLQ